MDQSSRNMVRAGADATALEDFRALAEATTPDGAPRYAERPVLLWLARYLAGIADTPNRDTPLYELCHLVNMVEAAGSMPERRWTFFLGLGRAVPATFQTYFDDALAAGGWRRPGFERRPKGISAAYDEAEFTITFARMPHLAALYEFLCGMDGFAFHAEFAAVLDTMVATSGKLAAVKTATNAIASKLRRYRRGHLTRVYHEDRFTRLFAFLKARGDEGDRLRIDDEAVLAFWRENATAGDFRAFATVFDAFVALLRTLEETHRAEAAGAALAIGTDRDQGEVEPEDGVYDLGSFADWCSPFEVLDAEPTNKIKFFKKEGERKPIENLMRYGPRAEALPLSFLRLEAFGPVQSGISNDLRVKRGADSVHRRLDCTDAVSYRAHQAQFTKVLAHVGTLQKAVLYALHRGNETVGTDDGSVVALRPRNPEALFDAARRGPEPAEGPDADATARLLSEAEQAFKGLTRKGFDAGALADEAHAEGFRAGATALLAVGGVLERFLGLIARLDAEEPGLDDRFEDDRAMFARQFKMLYGEVA